jgi:hypothetical protein
MKQWFPVSLYVFALALLLPLANRSRAYQSPVAHSEQGGATEPKLTAAEEKDSYEIYSMLLRTEMPPQWNVTEWAITQETQTFPAYGSAAGGNVRECLNVSHDQEPTYLPLLEDYVRKNTKKRVLERKFDLLQYVLIGGERPPSEVGLPFRVSVTFQVSAVGFDRDGTRALVYVGHHCGNLCGGGGYHLLVKKDGKWQADREYWGMSCLWVA